MRTTLTLEPDVEQLLREVMRADGISFKEALNAAVRRGLRPQRGRERFRTPAFALGEPTIALTKALEVAAALEDDEIIRKISVSK